MVPDRKRSGLLLRHARGKREKRETVPPRRAGHRGSLSDGRPRGRGRGEPVELGEDAGGLALVTRAQLGVVRVRDVARLVLEGQPPTDGWVIDDRLEGIAAARTDWRDCLGEPVKVLSLSFTFNNGAKVTFSDSLVRLTLLEKKRFLETWTGPL